MTDLVALLNACQTIIVTKTQTKAADLGLYGKHAGSQTFAVTGLYDKKVSVIYKRKLLFHVSKTFSLVKMFFSYS